MRPEDIEGCSHDGGLRGARATDEHGEARADPRPRALGLRHVERQHAEPLLPVRHASGVRPAAPLIRRSDLTQRCGGL